MGKAIKKVGNLASPLTFGLTDKLSGGKLGTGIENALLGKKIAGTSDSFTQLDPLQQELLGKYKGFMDKGGDTVGAQIAQQEKSAIQGAKDAEIRANQAIAQRGLEGSSVGLSSVINASRGLSDQLGAIRAQRPALEQQNEMNKLGFATSGINSILGTRMFKQGTQGGRSGGLLPLIGAGVGGYFGDAGGAQVGAGIGQALIGGR